ncbi:MAG: DUF6122 family protein [Myxococcota bacterium]
MIRIVVHMVLHVAVPGIAARLGYPTRWLRAWAWMMTAMLIDLDHLLADPIFAPGRCSIGFHPLHTWPAILAYAVLTAIPRTRVVGIGLLIHITLDLTDCLWMRLG